MTKGETPLEGEIIPKEEAAQVKPSRDALRAKLFAEEHVKVKKVPLTYNGVELEWRQPSIKDIQEAEQDEDKRNFMVLMLIRYTYVPDTDEKVFEEEDYETLLNMPMNQSFQNAVRTISSTLDLKVEEKVKN